MKQFICMKENHIEILTEEQITERTKGGVFFQQYYEIGREMELMIKLVPKKADETAAPKKKAGKQQQGQ